MEKYSQSSISSTASIYSSEALTPELDTPILPDDITSKGLIASIKELIYFANMVTNVHIRSAPR